MDGSIRATREKKKGHPARYAPSMRQSPNRQTNPQQMRDGGEDVSKSIY